MSVTSTDADALATLTPRELEVLIYAAKGLHNREIGRLVGLGTWTVNDHLKQVNRKLDVSTRVEAAVIAAKAGLV